MIYKLWRISGIDDGVEKKLHECYDNLDSPEKKYLERPDAAQKGKCTVMVLTDSEDSEIQNFEEIYRTILDELPLKGCSYASKYIAEDDMEWTITEFLGIGSAISGQIKSEKKINVQGTKLTEMLESYILTKYGDKEWFSSTDVKKDFDADVKKIGLSTVSTYLARMSRDDILTRRGKRNNRQYQITDDGRKTLKERYRMQDDV